MGKTWNKWKQFAEKVGTSQINLVFSLLFFLIISPIGIIANLFSDLLKTKKFPEWTEVIENYSTIKKLKNQ